MTDDSPPATGGGKALEDRLLVRLGCRLHIPLIRWYCRLRWEGVEHVPLERGAILCPNHASYLDPTFLFYPIFFHRGRRLVRFLAVDIYFKGLLGWYLRLFESIRVSKDRIDLKAYRETIARLNEGKLVGIFPEGERTRDGRFMTFQIGAACIAIQTGAPLIPVTINGTYHVLPRHWRFPRPAPVEIIFHPPIDVDPSDRLDMDYAADLTRRLEETIGSRYVVP